MTRCIPAYGVSTTLTRAGHTDSTRSSAWTPGHRVQQASPRTIRVWHDGPDEQLHLDQYATALRAAGFTVIPERRRGKRPTLRVTHP
jgi:hypothetical protein